MKIFQPTRGRVKRKLSFCFKTGTERSKREIDFIEKLPCALFYGFGWRNEERRWKNEEGKSREKNRFAVDFIEFSVHFIHSRSARLCVVFIPLLRLRHEFNVGILSISLQCEKFFTRFSTFQNDVFTSLHLLDYGKRESARKRCWNLNIFFKSSSSSLVCFCWAWKKPPAQSSHCRF